MSALAGCSSLSSMVSPAPDATADATADATVESDDAGLPVRNYLAARFAVSEHDMAEAAKFYRATLAEDPNNADLLSAAFIYSSSSGDLEGAAKLAQKIVATSPGDRSARLILALTALKHRNYADARKQLAASQKGAFTALTGALFDAWASAGLGDSDAVEADLKSLSGQSGGESIAALHRALIMDTMGRTGQEMDNAYQQALEQNQTNARLIDSYGRYLERSGRGREADALYARFANAPGVAPIASAGRARIAAGKKPDKLIHNAGEGAAEALVGIASSLSDANSVDVSIFYLRMALYLRPDFDLASVILGARYEALEKYEDANAAYGAIKTNSPYYRMTAIERALNEARLDNMDSAISQLTTLADANPTDVEIWTSLGDTYRSAERYDEAAKAYDHAVAQLGTAQARDWTLYYSRAAARESNHDWNGAEADLKKALELSPDQPQVMNFLGYNWIEQGQNLPEAVSMLEKARSMRPFDGYIVDSVGWAYYRLGRYDEAAQTLQDAVQLVPGDPTINDHLGDALWRVGRKLDAQFQWNHALAFDPEPEERADIEKKLQTGLSTDLRG